MSQIKNPKGLKESGAPFNSKNSTPNMELGNPEGGLSPQSIPFEELDLIIRAIDNILRETPFRLALVRASTVTEDNSNIYQTAQLRTEPDEMFLKIIWMSPRPYEWGIAVYKKFPPEVV